MRTKERAVCLGGGGGVATGVVIRTWLDWPALAGSLGAVGALAVTGLALVLVAGLTALVLAVRSQDDHLG
jgi:hypothetical protein